MIFNRKRYQYTPSVLIPVNTQFPSSYLCDKANINLNVACMLLLICTKSTKGDSLDGCTQQEVELRHHQRVGRRQVPIKLDLFQRDSGEGFKMKNLQVNLPVESNSPSLLSQRSHPYWGGGTEDPVQRRAQLKLKADNNAEDGNKNQTGALLCFQIKILNSFI